MYRNMKKKLSVLIIILSQFTFLQGQIQEFKYPYSFVNKLDIEIPIIKMEEFNIDSLLEEDKSNIFLKPYRFAKVLDVDINSSKDGIWYNGENFRIWFVSVKSENAYSLSLTFSNFKLPENAKLFVYNKSNNSIVGALTSQNNNINNILTIHHIEGDEITIEYFEPADIETNTEISISEVSHDYRNILNSVNSEYCEVNINCDEGADWQETKRAVVKYTYNENKATYLCTGTLVSNMALNSDPYLLTAEHCLNNQSAVNSAVYYFNYESGTCDGTTGPTTQTMSGGTLKATGQTLDFSLILLNSLPPQNYLPFYSGWANDIGAPLSSVCIHHPAGDIKKISKDFNPAVTGNFDDYYENSTHWQILNWDIGTTEGGSSGAPLFNPNHQIIGTLTGGEANCSNSVNDYFQKLVSSWNYFVPEGKQLKHWLDPYVTNQGWMNGYDPYYGFGLAKPSNLIATLSETNNVILSWLPAVKAGKLKSESFENFSDFSGSFGNWQQLYFEESSAYGVDNFDFKNEGEKGFLIFNSNSTYPENQQGWETNSGNKCLAYFSSTSGKNNSWLITPQIMVDTNKVFSFWAKSVSDDYSFDKFKILISTTSNSKEEFYELISDEIFTNEKWSEYIFDLSDFEGQNIYIAIQVVSENSFCLLLDDFLISERKIDKSSFSETSAFPQFECESQRIEVNLEIELKNENEISLLQGYNIYRNFELIASVPSTQLTYTDNNLIDGRYFYYISAAYSEGNSYPTNLETINIGVSVTEIEDYCFKLYPNPANNILTVDFDEYILDGEIFIYSIDGKKVYSEVFKNSQSLNVDVQNFTQGIYIMQFRADEIFQSCKFFKN